MLKLLKPKDHAQTCQREIGKSRMVEGKEREPLQEKRWSRQIRNCNVVDNSSDRGKDPTSSKQAIKEGDPRIQFMRDGPKCPSIESCPVCQSAAKLISDIERGSQTSHLHLACTMIQEARHISCVGRVVSDLFQVEEGSAGSCCMRFLHW